MTNYDIQDFRVQYHQEGSIFYIDAPPLLPQRPSTTSGTVREAIPQAPGRPVWQSWGQPDRHWLDPIGGGGSVQVHCQVELIELMRDPFLFSNNLNYLTFQVRAFKACHLPGKQFISPTPPMMGQNRPIRNDSANDWLTSTDPKPIRQQQASTDIFEPKPP